VEVPEAPPAPAAGALRLLRDQELMDLQRELAAVRRRVDASSAAVAGELARRSARDLGYRGLAQSQGDRTPENLVARLAGVSVPEARTMVSVGEVLATGEREDGPAWLEPVSAAVTAGELSVGAAAAIRTGLGEPGDGVGADALRRAAESLAREAAQLPPELVARRARQMRDALDADGVQARELALRGRRYLRLFRQDDGMTRISGLLDPESAALVTDAFDRVTAPRRGGVRFVNLAEQERADRIVADPRTTDQLAHDAFVEMIRLAIGVDDGAIFGVKSPAVRVHVRARDLSIGRGAAHLEGQTSAISIATVARIACQAGSIPILFDGDGSILNLGRTERLFSAAQRIALAARDGGCRIPGCSRPPSWCEAHHIQQFSRGGKTDIADGILLCRHHHMWLHDTGRYIERRGAEYWLHAPGPGESPVRLPSKHPLATSPPGG
jgi:hypothetical protein